MPDGERSKRLATLEKLAEKLVKQGADRGVTLIALGGGVVGDVTGFLASIYMRGVDVIQAPTTVLAQVDAAIGGKTGVNLASGKNLLGTFHQPRAVLVDPSVLETLPSREYQAGLYESLKCGIIGDPELFKLFEDRRREILDRDPVVIEKVIADSVRLKASVVSADEREGGLRQILNLGHTIGHALEAETRYTQLLHGEAVAWGMIAATHIAALHRKTRQRNRWPHFEFCSRIRQAATDAVEDCEHFEEATFRQENPAWGSSLCLAARNRQSRDRCGCPRSACPQSDRRSQETGGKIVMGVWSRFWCGAGAPPGHGKLHQS
jgi:3-dehydroquinate synthase